MDAHTWWLGELVKIMILLIDVSDLSELLEQCSEETEKCGRPLTFIANVCCVSLRGSRRCTACSA